MGNVYVKQERPTVDMMMMTMMMVLAQALLLFTCEYYIMGFYGVILIKLSRPE